MSRFNVKIEHVPNYKESCIYKNDLAIALSHKGISPDLLWDNAFYYFSLEDWGKVFTDILKNMPEYTADKFDCDNFALLTVTRITEKYKVNGAGVAIGDSPWGYHGWNIFVASPFELFYLEPQTGQIIELDDGEYKAHYVVWG